MGATPKVKPLPPDEIFEVLRHNEVKLDYPKKAEAPTIFTWRNAMFFAAA